MLLLKLTIEISMRNRSIIYPVFKSTCKGDNSEYATASCESVLQSDLPSLHFDRSGNNVAIERASNGLDRT